MKSITDIDLMVKSAAENAARIEAETETAEKEKASLMAQANAAAEAGDLPLYRKLKAQVDALDDAAFVRAAQLKKLSRGVSESDVRGAWSNYAADHDKTLASMLSDLEKKKAAFLDAYKACMDKQRDALVVRERLAGYIESDPASFGMQFIPFAASPYRMPVTDATAAFYMSERRNKAVPPTNDAMMNEIISVVQNHKSR